MKKFLDLGVILALGLSGTACTQVKSTSPPGVTNTPLTVTTAPPASVDFDKDMPSGFDISEAKDMIELCIDLSEPSTPSRAAGWELKFDGSQEAGRKGVGPYNNAWKLWKKQGAENVFAIAIRGTIEDWNSIKEDLLATSLNATHAEITLGQNRVLPLVLAGTSGAEAHLGFSYGMAVLMFHKELGILRKLKELVSAGSRVYITGHSQGAALATLTHSFLHYAMRDPTYGLQGFGLKSYLFAQPKPGNWQYSMDFAKIAANRGLSYVVNNALDWVPQLPITVEFIDEPLRDIAAEYIHDLPVAERKVVEAGIGGLKILRAQVAERVKDRVEGKIQGYFKNLDEHFFTSKPAGEPAATADSINYISAGNLIAVSGADDPSIRHDGIFTQHHATNYRKLLYTLAK
ncbi:hypothetical protein [Methylococcus sp. EFPC2]|uniref:lipase family protein n=1 Tax=Methylococcus sp. EFPC2 TaxID=2812648 RepID=UPI0019689DEF|nr:hypothetical protein [Methylococcus sp. EFPC2]QSA97798.1 hypothetical protein JWZ97_02915 [Methylococcus sp. EFPC2]